ncbi:MAG: helix-hairpin-helix domain-containing protein [Syntrophobacteria bacterium]
MAQRNRLGGFSKLEDLRAVKGIGPVTLKRLRPSLTVGTKD